MRETAAGGGGEKSKWMGEGGETEWTESFSPASGPRFLRLLGRENTITPGLRAECSESPRGLFLRAIIIIVGDSLRPSGLASAGWNSRRASRPSLLCRKKLPTAGGFRVGGASDK